MTVPVPVRGFDWTFFLITYIVSGSTITYPLYVNAALKAAVPPQIDVLAAILVVSLVFLAVGTLYRRKWTPSGCRG